ncbi:hypothetical protein T08_9863, partial [Trichinella sp. T8]
MQILPHSVGQAKNALSPLPLERGKALNSPLQGRGACALPAQRARKSLHSPLS